MSAGVGVGMTQIHRRAFSISKNILSAYLFILKMQLHLSDPFCCRAHFFFFWNSHCLCTVISIHQYLFISMWKKLKIKDVFKDLFFYCVCVCLGMCPWVQALTEVRGVGVPLGLELESRVVMSPVIRLVEDQMSHRCSLLLNLSVQPQSRVWSNESAVFFMIHPPVFSYLTTAESDLYFQWLILTKIAGFHSLFAFTVSWFMH